MRGQHCAGLFFYGEGAGAHHSRKGVCHSSARVLPAGWLQGDACAGQLLVYNYEKVSVGCVMGPQFGCSQLE
jgi:hypothetical protein